MLRRDIWKTRTRFLSIFLMIFVSATMFAGIYAITPTMQKNVDDMLNRHNIYDIALIKNDGWKSEEIDQITKSISEIETVETRNTKDAIVRSSDNSYVTRIMSQELWSDENLVSGVRITKANECIVDERLDVNVGEIIHLDDGAQKKDCTIVGKARFAEYFSQKNKGKTYLRNGQIETTIIVSPEFFKGMPTELLIHFKGMEGYSTFSTAYENKVHEYSRLLHQKSPFLFDVRTRLDIDSVAAYKEDSEKIKQIGAIFPLIFIIVSILVVLTTMTRMIDEDRSIIGTLKSLGYKKIQLLLYYQTYIAIPTIIGSILGIALGIYLFPSIVMQAYQSLYSVPNIQHIFDVGLNFMVFFLLVGLLFVVTTLTVLKTVNEKPSELLRPKAPIAGKKIFLEYIPFMWKRLKFVDKVTMRNIFRYKKRLLMSLFGIAGSTAILLTALGLYTSIAPTVNKQFEEIQLYDYTLFPKNHVSDDLAYQDNLRSIDGVENILPVFQTNVQVVTDKKDESITMVIPNQIETFSDFIHLYDAERFYSNPNKQLLLNETSVLISQKASRLFGVHVKDFLHMTYEGKTYALQVTGIVENYYGNMLYVAPQLFSKTTGESIKSNSIFVKVNSSHPNKSMIVDEIVKKDPMLTVVEKEKNKSLAIESIKSVNSIVLLMIGFAILLIIIVIYNLNSINIVERTRELATIKVLGFYNREMVLYIFKESIITTIVAALLGLLFGIPIHLFIIMQSEIASIQFIYTIPFFIYIAAFTLTILIAIITILFMIRKIYKIDMITSLKSIE